jgi:hypothetical protein
MAMVVTMAMIVIVIVVSVMRVSMGHRCRWSSGVSERESVTIRGNTLWPCILLVRRATAIA